MTTLKAPNIESTNKMPLESKELNLKTVRIPLEVKKTLSTTFDHDQEETQHSNLDKSLEDHIVQQLMDYRGEAVAKGYINLNIPLPPNLDSLKQSSTETQLLKQFLSDANPRIEKCKPLHQDKQHTQEIRRVTTFVKSQVEKSSSQPENDNLSSDRDQWVARAMKRNPNVLSLMERMRPISKHASQSSNLNKTGLSKEKTNSQPGSESNSPRHISKTPENVGGTINLDLLNSKGKDSMKMLQSSSGGASNLMKHFDLAVETKENSNNTIEEGKKSVLDYSNILGTVENREVLSREVLIQLIYQDFAQRGYYKTIMEMENETGIKYNGYRSDKAPNKDTLVSTLLSIGIRDIEKPYEMPQSDLVDLDNDVEIQTSSIYHHFDPDYVEEMQKPLWSEISLPEEESVLMDGKELKGATLNKLIEKLTSSSADGKFIQCFLVTYRSFTDPMILLKKLFQRYKVPKSIPSEERIQIQLRTAVIFNRWIEDYFSWDWNESMIRDFLVFIDDFLLKEKMMANLGEKLKQKIVQKMFSKNKESNLVFSERSQAPDVPRNVFSPKLTIWDIREEELAKQLTYMDHNMFRNIEPHELLNCAWSKPNLKHRAKNINKITGYVNNLANWFACQIVKEDSLKERKAKLTKLMKVAIYLYKLNNFNSLMALSSSYNYSAIYRLKFTQAEIDETLKKEFTEASSIVDPTIQKNYSLLRNHIKKVAKPPLNIFLGVYQTDLMMIEEGNQDFIKLKQSNSKERKLVNWKKSQLVANTISEVMQYKFPPYNIQHVHQIQELVKFTLETHEHIEANELNNISLTIEPRSAQRREDLKQ